MRRLFRRHSIKDCNSGLALVEFALVLPLLLYICLGIIEFSRLAIIHQKLDKAANSMADFVTQGTCISTGDMDTFTSALNNILRPFAFDGSVIFSSLVNSSGAIGPCASNQPGCISWQYRSAGSDGSHIGTAGANAALPGSYVVLPGQNAIVAELSLDYEPMLALSSTFIPGLGSHNIYKIVVYKPRQGTLTTIDGACT